MFQGVYHGKTCHAPDLAAVLRRSMDYGVQRIMVTGTSLEECKETIALCRQYSQLYPGMLKTTIGVHPTCCSDFVKHPSGPASYLASLSALIKEHKDMVVALGEFGLDYARLEYCPEDVQKMYFRLQFDLLDEHPDLPLFLHMRDAAADFIAIIKENRHRFKHGVVHSFTGTIEEALAIIELDLYIGINGW